MTLDELKEKARVAQITRDLSGYVYAVEEYCKANDVDVWQITRRLIEVIEREKDIDYLDTLLDLAGLETVESLEIFIANAKSTGELLDEVVDIKDDVKVLYKKLIGLTSTLSQRQDT